MTCDKRQSDLNGSLPGVKTNTTTPRFHCWRGLGGYVHLLVSPEGAKFASPVGMHVAATPVCIA